MDTIKTLKSQALKSQTRPLNKKILSLCGILLITGALSACNTAQYNKTNKKDDLKFNNLLEINDLSERAFVYYEYCLKKTEPINETFMENFRITSDMLLNEGVYNMNTPPELLVQRVLNRRKVIQQKLSKHYYSAGCQSNEGRIANAHYRAFSEMRKKEIKNLIK
jgi:hypothetical protein